MLCSSEKKIRVQCKISALPQHGDSRDGEEHGGSFPLLLGWRGLQWGLRSPFGTGLSAYTTFLHDEIVVRSQGQSVTAFPWVSRGSGAGPLCKEVRVAFVKVSVAT